jgi:hypothetical protein
MGRDGVLSEEFDVTIDLQISHQDAGQEHGSDWADVCWRCILARWALLARGSWEGKEAWEGDLSGGAEQGSRGEQGGAGFEALRDQSTLASAHLRKFTCRRRDLQACQCEDSQPASCIRQSSNDRPQRARPACPACHRVCLLVCCPSPTTRGAAQSWQPPLVGRSELAPPIKGIWIPSWHSFLSSPASSQSIQELVPYPPVVRLRRLRLHLFVFVYSAPEQCS